METKQKLYSHFNLKKKANNKLLDLFSVIFIVFVIFSFLKLVFKNTVNTPNFDDFAYLEYTLRLINSSNFSSFIGELLSKHNGHGVTTAKLAFWLNYILQGEINFRHLILLSTILVVLIFAFFIWLFKSNGLSVFSTIPVALLLFNPLYYENVMWAAATWQYTASIASCLTMYFLLTRKGIWPFATALFLGFLTTYTNGNGIIGFFLGAIILFPKRNYKLLTIWLIVVTLTATLYYTNSPPGFGNKQGHQVAPFFITLISFMATTVYYLRLNITDLIIAGVLVSGIFVAVLIRSASRIAFSKFLNSNKKNTEAFEQKPANLALLAFLGWLFFTGLCVAWTRGESQFSIVQRYMIYSILNLTVLYSLFIIISPVKFRLLIRLSGIITGLTFQFCAYLYSVPEIINFRNSLWADVYNLKNHRHVSGKIETMNNNFTKATFGECIRKGIYTFPETPIPDSNAELLKIQNQVLDTLTKFNITKDTLESYSGILITSFSCNKIAIDESDPTNCIYLALKDEKSNQIHLIPAKPTQNVNRKNFLKNHNHFNPGIVASVYEDNVTPGWYTIGTLTIQNKTSVLTFTNQEVEIGKIY